MEDRTFSHNQPAEWRGTHRHTAGQPTADANADEAYRAAYDRADAEMWRTVVDTLELVDRVIRGRAWLRAHQDSVARDASDCPSCAALFGKYDAVREAVDLLMPAVATQVLLAENATQAAPVSFRPGPVRPDCPQFCRSVHREQDGETTVHVGESTRIHGRRDMVGSPAPVVQVALVQVAGDEPHVELVTGDVELDEDAAYRLGVELIRQVGEFRRQRRNNFDLSKGRIFEAAHEPGS